MESESCRVCGGDGRISNAMGGSETNCPSCHGSGHRTMEPLFRDVTKTKESHHRATNRVVPVEKRTSPSTLVGKQLGDEVKASALPEETKTRLVHEIIEYEESHGSCTKTFTRKVRKQLR